MDTLLYLQIKESDGDVFEELRSNEQFLTFEKAKKSFEKYKIEFNEEKYLALGLVFSKDKIFTNTFKLVLPNMNFSEFK